MKKLLVFFCAMVLSISTIRATAAYSPGFVWDRSADWTQGQNPDGDSMGNSAWSYEFYRGIPINGGVLGSGSPWYNYSKGMLTWRSSDRCWICPENGGWPGVFPTYQYTSAQETGTSWAPLIRWTNPTGASIEVNLRFVGAQLSWQGYYSRCNPAPIDLAILLVDASQSNATTLLYGHTYHKPTHGDQQGNVDISLLEIPNISVAPSDQIVVT